MLLRKSGQPSIIDELSSVNNAEAASERTGHSYLSLRVATGSHGSAPRVLTRTRWTNSTASATCRAPPNLTYSMLWPRRERTRSRAVSRWSSLAHVPSAAIAFGKCIASKHRICLSIVTTLKHTQYSVDYCCCKMCEEGVQENELPNVQIRTPRDGLLRSLGLG